MKTDELKTGDWVFYESPVTSEKEIAKVVGVTYNDNLVTVEPLSAKRLLVFDNEISGVPLTKEIMEKNFDCCSGGVLYSRDGLNFELIYRNKKRKILQGIVVYKQLYDDFEGPRGAFLSYVLYVHELQHILWALGWRCNLKL